MKKIMFLSLLTFMLLGLTLNDAQAQKKKSDKANEEYFDESGGSFKNKLWYGGGFNLGFSGNNGQSAFQLGLSPMVGYKFWGPLSVGPRIGFNWTLWKLQTGSGVKTLNLTDYSVGAFLRAKFFQNFFAHTEYELMNQELPYSGPNDFFTERANTSNYYLGLGYTSGGQFGYEISLLYNFLQDKESLQLPISIRAGFNYNF